MHCLPSPCSINMETCALPPSALKFLALRKESIVTSDLCQLQEEGNTWHFDWHSDNAGEEKELRGLAVVLMTLAIWEGNWGCTNAVSLSWGFAEEGQSMGYCSGSAIDPWGRGKRRDLYKLQTRFLEGEAMEDHCIDRVRTIWGSVQGCHIPGVMDPLVNISTGLLPCRLCLTIRVCNLKIQWHHENLLKCTSVNRVEHCSFNTWSKSYLPAIDHCIKDSFEPVFKFKYVRMPVRLLRQKISMYASWFLSQSCVSLLINT